MSTVAIIQARMGSTRLPGKVMRGLGGKPMLHRVIEATHAARRIDRVVVATTDTREDSEIEAFCRSQGWSCFCGHESDVLDRYYRTAAAYGARTVVRITADCPLIDPRVIDRVIARYVEMRDSRAYVSNIHPIRTFPRGMDTEVFSFDALEAAWRADQSPEWREHVTPYLYRTPSEFKVVNVLNDTDRSDLRLTVDTETDLRLVSWVIEQIGDSGVPWEDVAELLDRSPTQRDSNRHIQQKVV